MKNPRKDKKVIIRYPVGKTGNFKRENISEKHEKIKRQDNKIRRISGRSDRRLNKGRKIVKESCSLEPPIIVGMIGVFGDSNSSNIRFAEGFRNCEEVSKVLEYDYRFIVRNQPRSLLTSLEEFSRSCDFIIICKGNGLSTNTIITMSQHAKILLWYMDYYPNLSGHREVVRFGNYCDWRSATGYDTARLWKKLIGLEVLHILDGSNPDEYYPLNIDKTYDITFIGAKDYERKTIEDFLLKMPIKTKFFGPGFTRFVGAEEFNQICNRSKITLNISRGNYAGYSSLRLWNLMATGAFVLTKKIREMNQYMGLKDNIHLGEFSTLLELEKKVQYYLKYGAIREKIAKTGYEYVINNRTWYHSAKEILKLVLEGQTEKFSNPKVRKKG